MFYYGCCIYIGENICIIEKNTIDKENYAELINQIKIKSKLNITEKRLPQDGRIEYENFDLFSYN